MNNIEEINKIYLKGDKNIVIQDINNSEIVVNLDNQNEIKDFLQLFKSRLDEIVKFVKDDNKQLEEFKRQLKRQIMINRLSSGFVENNYGNVYINENKPSIDANLSTNQNLSHEKVSIIVEELSTGVEHEFIVSVSNNINYLINTIIKKLNLKLNLELTDYDTFNVRWVVIEKGLKTFWGELDRIEKQNSYLIYKETNQVVVCKNLYEKIEKVKAINRKKFNLFSIEDTSIKIPPGKLA